MMIYQSATISSTRYQIGESLYNGTNTKKADNLLLWPNRVVVKDQHRDQCNYQHQ